MKKYHDIVLDNSGNAVLGATITVTDNGGGASTIYSDNGITVQANPFTASSVDGAYSFYASNGRYDINITATGFTTENLTDITLYDPDDLETIADLRAIPSAPTIEIATIKGYATDGDGGGGDFYWDSTSTETDNGGTIIKATAITTGRWKRLYSGVVNVRWFGAKGDNSTDDIISIQNAIDSLASTGGKVYLPKGNYLVSAAIELYSNYVSIVGDGEYATDIKTTSATDNVIEIGDGATAVANCWVENMAVNSTVAKTAGAGILLQNHHFCGVKRVRQDTNLHDGILVEGGASQFGTYLQDLELNTGTNVALRLGASLTAKDTYISNIIIGGELGARGIEIQQASGVFATNIDILTRDIGIKITPGASEVARNMFFTNVLADTCTSDGWQFIGAGEISQVNMTNCWSASNGKTAGDAGVSFNNADTDGVTISGMTVINNGGNGIELIQGTNISIVGGSQIYFNDTDAAGAHGIEIAANVSGWTISGNRIGQGGQFAGNNQDYGVFINTGSSDEYIITDNDLTGNSIGAINSIANGTDKEIRGNKGFVTYNRGVATVPLAAGVKVVTHGMSSTPALQNIRITPTTDTQAARWWVASTTSSTFTIQFNATVGSDVDFSWEVDLSRG